MMDFEKDDEDMPYSIVGKGTYGCVVHPACIVLDKTRDHGDRSTQKSRKKRARLNEDGDTSETRTRNGHDIGLMKSRSFVSKLFFFDSDAFDEWNNYEAVRRLDKHDKFTLGSLGISRISSREMCPSLREIFVDAYLKRVKMDVEDEYKLDKLISKKKKEFSVYQIVYEMKGRSLDTLNVRSLGSFETILSNFLDLLQNGFMTLENNRLVHGDVKPSNILWDGHRFILIDMGNVTHYDENFYSQCTDVCSHPYPFYPPEMIFLYFHKTGKDDAMQLDEFRKRFTIQYKFYEHLSLFGDTTPESVFSYMNDLKSLADFGMSYETAYYEIMTQYDYSSIPVKRKDSHKNKDERESKSVRAIDYLYHEREEIKSKFDVFSVGVVLSFLLHECISCKNIDDYKHCDEVIRPIISKMCDVNVFTRLSMRRAISLLRRSI